MAFSSGPCSVGDYDDFEFTQVMVKLTARAEGGGVPPGDGGGLPETPPSLTQAQLCARTYSDTYEQGARHAPTIFGGSTDYCPRAQAAWSGFLGQLNGAMTTCQGIGYAGVVWNGRDYGAAPPDWTLLYQQSQNAHAAFKRECP